MTEVGREIPVEGVDPRELYGPQNVYLDQIKALHPSLRIVARGSTLKVLGSDAETAQFRKRFEGFTAYYLKYGHVSAQVVDQCFAGSSLSHEGPIDKDVIVYGNNGNIVRARTVNQQRLVELFGHNDLLFAVGPAGSGKTYTAFIVTGDVTQIDLPHKTDSGLVRAMEILRSVRGIGIVEFDRRDIVRHELVKQIVEAFDRSAKNEE